MTPTIADAARLYQAHELDQAARACLDIIAAEPTHFDALHLLGVISTNQSRHADAVSFLLRAAAVRPTDAHVQAVLGGAYGGLQRFDKAIACFRQARELGLRDAGSLNNLGLALRGQERTGEAIEAFQAALALDPGNDPALYNLAHARAASGLLRQAEADYRALLARLPADTPVDRVREVTNELARALADQGRAEDSLAVLRDAIAKHPDTVSFRWHEALMLLLLGRFDEGWRAYETRWDAPDHDRPHPAYRVLDLSQIAGQTVLVKEEQGRGDIIQFLRFLRPLSARGARIRLSTYPDLIPLALEMPEIELVLQPGEDETAFDQLTSVMSLPLAFGTDLATIPAEVPYLRAPAARIGRMTAYLGTPRGLRVGLTWSGSTASHARAALPAATLAPLLDRADVEFHCMQKDIRPEDRAWLDQTGRIATHETMLRDFGDTAALIEAMDLIVSIDTAIAHLAGALAKPVWILLPFNPDWRWLMHRTDTPWYPTARLFRQPAPGDWPGAVEALTRSFLALPSARDRPFAETAVLGEGRP